MRDSNKCITSFKLDQNVYTFVQFNLEVGLRKLTVVELGQNKSKYQTQKYN